MTRTLLAGSLLSCFLMQVTVAADHPREKYFVDWAGSAVVGMPLKDPSAGDGLDVHRQDHGQLELNRSVVRTPLRIGSESFAHGLGTHAISDILLRLPKPAQALRASIGVDNNGPNGTGLGSVMFVVQLAERQVYRSPVCRGGEAPRKIDVPLSNARTVRLRVFDAADGQNYDQADWAEASILYADGTSERLDEMPVFVRPTRYSGSLPFSMKIDGLPLSEGIRAWKKDASELPAPAQASKDLVTFRNPVNRMRIDCELIRYRDVPAVEWVLSIRNEGDKDTPVIEEIRPLDLTMILPATGDVELYGANGSTAAATDYLPTHNPVRPGEDLSFSPNGGRSSDGRLPFFNLAWQGGGLMTAIGWTGQWNLGVTRNKDDSLRLFAGQEKTHLVLHPGEQIRTPRILMVAWEGSDRLRGHNLLRKTLVEHYMPRREGQVIMPMTSQNTWFVYGDGNGVNEKNQLEAIHQMAGWGTEAYWLDAGWFEGGWPNGVGNWSPRPEIFPNGLKPLADAAHKHGMKFILWFEPERVNAASRIAKEHPEWVLHAGNGDGLFNLGHDDARKWLTALLSKCISEWGVDVYRNDFNMPPLNYWRAADPPDRVGMTEIRYIQGLYEMWDALAQVNGGTILDDCASGGRRIDLEMIRRAVVLTRSDSVGVNKPMPLWEQTQTMGLSLYYPGHATLGFSFDPYNWFSTTTSGVSTTQDTRTGVNDDVARRLVENAKQLRPFWTGDFYPLTPIDQDERSWAAWQLDRPDLGRGCVLAFRRAESPYPTLEAHLHGIEMKATYRLTILQAETLTSPQPAESKTGEQLAAMRISIEKAPGASVFIYEKSH